MLYDSERWFYIERHLERIKPRICLRDSHILIERKAKCLEWTFYFHNQFAFLHELLSSFEILIHKTFIVLCEIFQKSATVSS